jgi:hypothetical protein
MRIFWDAKVLPPMNIYRVSGELSAFVIGVIQEEWYFDKNEIQIINRFTTNLVNASK